MLPYYTEINSDAKARCAQQWGSWKMIGSGVVADFLLGAGSGRERRGLEGSSPCRLLPPLCAPCREQLCSARPFLRVLLLRRSPLTTDHSKLLLLKSRVWGCVSVRRKP